MCANYNNSRQCIGDASGYYLQNQGYGDPNGMRSMPSVAHRQPRWAEQEPNLVASMSRLALQPSPNFQKLSKNFSKSHPYSDDLNEIQFNLKCKEYLSGLQLSPSGIASLQQQTVEQWYKPNWKEARRKRLTASYFGRVFHIRDTTPRTCLIEEMLYRNSISNIATNYGRDNEKNAIDDYEYFEGVDVQQCGLFVHPKYGYLGASPDGLVGEDGILEIKCPYSARNIPPLEIPSYKKYFYCTSYGDGTMRLKTEHNFYYQIQGELEVTGRKWCDFVVWTQAGYRYHVERIWRNKSVWDEMFPKLETFYKLSLLPELIDSRYARYLPIREPDFVLRAIEMRRQRM